MHRITFDVPATTDLDALAGELAAGHDLQPVPTQASRLRFFDSFDWRLHRDGCTLVRHDGVWRLERLEDGEAVAEAPTRAGPWPRFAWDFDADTRLARRLRKLLKMRALVHLVTAAGERRGWVVRNRDGKIVLRLEAEVITPERPAAASPLVRLDVLPLRGYEKPAEAARDAALRAGLVPTDGGRLDALLAAADLEPRSYSSKFRAEIAPDLPAREAFAAIGHVLLRTMRRNEAGLRADVDTEFLHDFRVAVRRQRSAFTHFRGVVDAAALAPFREGFAGLGRLTGRLRDLDVYLLDRERYRGLLPAELRPGLEPRFTRLAAEREAELTRVRRALGAAEYRDLVARWSAFLAEPPAGELADVPVIELARRRLRKRHRRVLRDGRAIDADSPDEALHRLRIDCKKLRYLLEFTATVFPAGEVDVLVAHLKALQDNLGEFNDLSVQRDDLLAALAVPGGRGRARLQEAAALGGLFTALTARRREVRAAFGAAFAAFTDPSVTDRFAALHADAGKKGRT